MNQVMKCNGTFYRGNAGEDTYKNLKKNASENYVRFALSFYYNKNFESFLGAISNWFSI